MAGTVADLAAVCAAYRAIAGQDDLQPEALCAAVRRRPLSPAYVAEKLDLLRHVMETGQVRRPRGFFPAALDRDWTAETAPHPTEALADGAPPASGEPASATADMGGLVGALHDLGVTASVAQRLARHNPGRVRQQLAWLPYRKAKDPTALIVRAVDEGWPEPPAAREARLAEARSREHERWAPEIDRARMESDSPEARRRGREALAEIRAMLARHRTSHYHARGSHRVGRALGWAHARYRHADGLPGGRLARARLAVEGASWRMILTFAKGRPVALVPRGRPLATTSPARVTGSVCASGVRLTLRYSG